MIYDLCLLCIIVLMVDYIVDQKNIVQLLFTAHTNMGKGQIPILFVYEIGKPQESVENHHVVFANVMML